MQIQEYVYSKKGRNLPQFLSVNMKDLWLTTTYSYCYPLANLITVGEQP